MPDTRRLSRRTLLAGATASLALPILGLAARTGHAQTGGNTAADVLPAALLKELPGARLLGTARMRFFGLDIYDARLWVGDDFGAANYAQSPLALELIYFRSLGGRAIAERSLKEMRRQGAITAEQEKAWLAGMEQAFPDVKSGDRIVGAHSPGVGARFWYNGQPRPALRDADFSRMFFGIWLSDASSEPKLRSQLLGLAA